MSAPANDSFYNATGLAGAASGSIGGTTVLATAGSASTFGSYTDAGEPGHPLYNPCPAYPVANATVGPYNSVWYKWTCPTTGQYYFTTRGQDAFGVPITSFKSTLQIFVANSTPAAVNNLTLIQNTSPIVTNPFGENLTSPVLYDQSVGAAAGLDNGASIAFYALAGTAYYIQIDTRAAGATGTFTMKWGAWKGLTIGECGSATNSNALVECFGILQIGDLTTNNFYSFGTIPAAPGNYAVMLAKGDPTLVNDYNGATPEAGVVDGNITACSNWANGDNTVWSCDTIYDIPASVCASTLIRHHTATQPIGIACLGNASATNSSQNPTYTLVYYPFTIDCLSNAAGWNELYNAAGTGATSGTTWKAKFNIINLTTSDFDTTTVTLLATGGITSPSAAQTIDLAASATSSTSEFTFTADPTAGLITATLQFARNGITVGTLSYPLYPIYSIAVTPNVTEFDCSSDGGTYTGKYWVTKIVCTPIWPPCSLQDFGYNNITCGNPYQGGITVRTQVVFTVTNSAGVNLYWYDNLGFSAPSACDPIAYNVGVVEYRCPENDAFTVEISTLEVGIQAGGSSQSVPITVAIQFQTSNTALVSLPSYTQTILISAA